MIYLGIDGGGSTCRARAVDAAGRLIGEGLAGPANITSDLEAGLAAILAAASAALGPHDPATVSAALGLAGANDSAAARALLRRLPFARSRVVTDGHIAVKGALGAKDGVVAALGTGSVFVVQRGGQHREIGGKGLILGDEASGAWIGRRLIADALRAQDGFAPLTPLLRETLVQIGGTEGAIAFAARARPADFAAFAPMVTTSDDPAAQGIMDLALSEVLAAITVLQASDTLPVVCLGGLGPVFVPRIARHFTVVAPCSTALDAAIALARD